MFIPGASSTSLPRSFISAPIAEYTSCTSSVSKLQAKSVPVGISEQVSLRRIPEGPSVVITGGIPFLRREGSTPANAPAFPAAPSLLFIV